MVRNMSPEEEQRGWSNAFIWAIAAIGLIAIIGIAGPLLTDYFFISDDVGMEGTTKTPADVAEEASSEPVTAAAIGIKNSSEFGRYLTNGEGRAIYLFEGDEQGSGDESAVSTCYEDCAKVWPPLATNGVLRSVKGVDESLLGTIERRDGKKQVTYNGWPLYHFARDFGPREATGQDVEDFGAEWYLVTPKGKKVEGQAGETG